MFRVVDYLVQAQGAAPVPGSAQAAGIAELRPLDTRGPGRAAWSAVVLSIALWRILRARMAGELAGVHVNVAERLSLLRKGLLVGWCKLLGVPVVLHLHAAQLPQNYAALPRPAQAWVRWLFNAAPCCIVLGRTAATFVTGVLGVPAERVYEVTNGVPGPRSLTACGARGAGSAGAAGAAPGAPMDGVNAAGRSEGAAKARTRHLLFVGNLSQRKGVPELLRALALPALAGLPLHATFAGGGEVERFREQALALGLASRVTFTGWASQAQVAALLVGADVLALPSYDEGLPLAVLEALGSGVPVVCTPVGEIPHLLQDGRHALLVQPGDADALAHALSRVLCEPMLAAALASEGRALYEARFSLASFAEAVAQVHARCFGVRAAPGTAGD